MRLRLIIVGYLLLTVAAFTTEPFAMPDASAGDKFETRCGWFDNPTPGNISLYDRDGEWLIGVQGGYQVEGDWDWPVFKPRQWVSTNAGSHGYGCVCMQLRVNRQAHEVLEIKSSRARPLAVCRKDQTLKKWKSMFE
jgi:Protein of unknown function (DUF4087)